MGELLTVADLADRLRVSLNQAMRLAVEGSVPTCWYGTQPLFDEDELTRFLADQSYHPRTVLAVDEIELPALEQPDERYVPYQLKNGRWSVIVACPDGVERRFVSRKAEPVRAEFRREQIRRLSNALRFAVLRRDGFRCRYCGRSGSEVVLNVDHVVSVADGGQDDMANLVTSCRDCNIGKHARSIDIAAIPPLAKSPGKSHERPTQGNTRQHEPT